MCVYVVKIPQHEYIKSMHIYIQLSFIIIIIIRVYTHI